MAEALRNHNIQDKTSDLKVSKTEPSESAEDSITTAEDFTCLNCPFTTYNAMLLSRHAKRVHNEIKIWDCQHCDYKTGERQNLLRHIKSIHEKIMDFACQICDYITSREDSLRYHIKATHLKINNLKCNSCDYVTTDSSNLKRHVNSSHLKVFAHQCDHCEYKTAHRGHLIRHMSNVHKIKNQKPFELTKEKGAQDLSRRKCPLCEFEAETEDSLTVHLMSCHVVSE